MKEIRKPAISIPTRSNRVEVDAGHHPVHLPLAAVRQAPGGCLKKRRIGKEGNFWAVTNQALPNTHSRLRNIDKDRASYLARETAHDGQESTSLSPRTPTRELCGRALRPGGNLAGSDEGGGYQYVSLPPPPALRVRVGREGG